MDDIHLFNDLLDLTGRAGRPAPGLSLLPLGRARLLDDAVLQAEDRVLHLVGQLLDVILVVRVENLVLDGLVLVRHGLYNANVKLVCSCLNCFKKP